MQQRRIFFQKLTKLIFAHKHPLNKGCLCHSNISAMGVFKDSYNSVKCNGENLINP